MVLFEGFIKESLKNLKIVYWILIYSLKFNPVYDGRVGEKVYRICFQ